MRTFNVAALTGAAVLLPGAADGFTSAASGILSAGPSAACNRCSAPAARRTTRAPSMMASYADRLKEAQAAKAASKAKAAAAAAAAAAGNGGEPAPPPPPASSSSRPNQSQDTMPQVADSPFSPALQEELRVAITTLAARLQREKPMTRAEFERFESAVGIIVEDALPLQDLPTRPAAGGGSAGPAAAASAAEAAPRRLVVVQSPVPPGAASAASSNTDDDFEVEGPQWDAKKVQYGLPMGVRNTYDIDDMDKMNPDEYQAALREKVIKRAQSVRKTGSYGNIVSNEYLKFLGKNPKTGDDKTKKNEKFVKSKGREDFGKY
eukprot:g2767.t1